MRAIFLVVALSATTLLFFSSPSSKSSSSSSSSSSWFSSVSCLPLPLPLPDQTLPFADCQLDTTTNPALPTNVHFVHLNTMTGALSTYSRIGAAVNQAANDMMAYPSRFLGPIKINVSVVDDGGTSSGAVAAFTNILYRASIPALPRPSFFFGDIVSGDIQAYSLLAGVEQIPVLSFGTAPELSDKTLYPYHNRVGPSDDQFGDGVIALCLKMKWKRLFVIHSSDGFGQSIRDYLTTTTIIENLPINVQSFSVGITAAQITSDMPSRIVALQQQDARIIVLVSSAPNVNAMLPAMYTSGFMNNPNMVIMGQWADWLAGFLGATGISYVTKYPGIYNGVVGITPALDLTNPATYTLWSRLKSLPAYNKTVNPITPIRFDLYAYESIITAGLALRGMYCNSSLAPTGANAQTVLRSFNFSAGTGPIALDSNGDRKVPFFVTNWDPTIGTTGDFKVVGAIVATSTLPPSDDPVIAGFDSSIVMTGSIVFASGGSSPPYDSAQPVPYVMPSYLMPTMTTLFGVVTGFIVLLFGFVLKCYKHPVLRAATASFLLLILLSALYLATSAYLMVQYPPTNTTCQATAVGHCAFVLLFTCLFVKTWRLTQIFKSQKLQAKSITDRDLALRGLVACIIVLAYYIAWMSVDAPSPRVTVFSFSTYVQCSSRSPYWSVALLVCEAGYIVYGCFLALEVKDIPDIFNESVYIGVGMYQVGVLGGLVILLCNFVLTDPTVVTMFESLGLLLITAIVIAVLFVPKILQVLGHGGGGSAASRGGQQQTRLELRSQLIQSGPNAHHAQGKRSNHNDSNTDDNNQNHHTVHRLSCPAPPSGSKYKMKEAATVGEEKDITVQDANSRKLRKMPSASVSPPPVYAFNAPGQIQSPAPTAGTTETGGGAAMAATMSPALHYQPSTVSRVTPLQLISPSATRTRTASARAVVATVTSTATDPEGRQASAPRDGSNAAMRSAKTGSPSVPAPVHVMDV